jgi:hypothetical protein
VLWETAKFYKEVFFESQVSLFLFIRTLYYNLELPLDEYRFGLGGISDEM